MNLMKQDQTVQIKSKGFGDQGFVPGNMLIPISIVFAQVEGVVGRWAVPSFSAEKTMSNPFQLSDLRDFKIRETIFYFQQRSIKNINRYSPFSI